MRSPIIGHRLCSLCDIVWIQTRIPAPPCYPSSSIFSCFTSLQLLSVVADGCSTLKDSARVGKVRIQIKNESVTFRPVAILFLITISRLGVGTVLALYSGLSHPPLLTMSSVSPSLRTWRIIDKAVPRCQAGRFSFFDVATFSNGKLKHYNVLSHAGLSKCASFDDHMNPPFHVVIE